MSEDWSFGHENLTSQPMGLVPTDNSLALCKGDLNGSSVSMVDSFCPTIWDHPNSQHLGFGDNNVHTSSNGLPATSRIGINGALGMGWNPPNSIPRGGGTFSQNGAGIFPQSLSQFPSDPASTGRAAKFSCINGGNFNYMENPFNISKPLNLYSKSGGPIQGPRDIHSADGLKLFLGAQSQNNEANMAEVAKKDVSMSIECNEREKNRFSMGFGEGKQGIGVSNNELDEAEFSTGGCQEEPSILESVGGEPSLVKGLGMKKRKRISQNAELDRAKEASQLSGEASKGDSEIKEKVDHNQTSATSKATGKHGKDDSQALDSPKEDYIHVRARRGQATNSHSLAERVRREKISERMKFLQELVPGCSKVTGKAVMLDEIINYVQSLQRQVEFLSMKLATVNPLLDFEGLLAKDILQSSGGPSTMGFPPDMSMVQPQLHPSYQGLIHAGIPGIGNPSDALRRTLNSQLTAMDSEYKELAPQIPNVWDDELHNVIRTSLGTNIPFYGQDLNGSLPQGNTKIEL